MRFQAGDLHQTCRKLASGDVLINVQGKNTADMDLISTLKLLGTKTVTMKFERSAEGAERARIAQEEGDKQLFDARARRKAKSPKVCIYFCTLFPLNALML